MSSKSAKKTSSSDAAAAKKVDVSFTSDSEDEDKSSSTSSSSSSESSSSSDESDLATTKPKPTKIATPPPSIAKTAEEDDDDDVETVTFTLSLSSVNIHNSPAEEQLTNEEKIGPKKTTPSESKTKASSTATAEERKSKTKEKSQESPPRKSPEAVIKLEAVPGDCKKTATKKTTKAGGKISKVEAINGGEETGAIGRKAGKSSAAAEEKVVVQAESSKKSTTAAEDAAAVVNGEAKTTVKTVKKKTKKASDDATTAPSTNKVVEEKPVTKSDATDNQSVKKKESLKTSTTNAAEETTNVAIDEAKYPAKVTKKKTKKPTSESEPVVAVQQEKDISRIDNSPVQKEKTEQDIQTVKSATDRKAPAAEAEAESSAAIGEAKPTAKTTVIKKKPKKVTGEASAKNTTQDDMAVSVANSVTTEKSTNESTNEKRTQVSEAEQRPFEIKETGQETASSSADKESTVSEAAGGEKIISKKKKPKKTTATEASAAAESEETTLTTTGAEHRNTTPINIDVAPASAADVDLSKKAVADVIASIPAENAVAEPESVASTDAVPLTENSTSKDTEKSAAPVVPSISTSEETELSNIVTLVQLDDIVNERSTRSTGAAVEMTTSAEHVSSEAKPTIICTDISISKDQTETDNSEKDSKNEESDFSYRRKSMDDFIKRILAEAREEQQKRMGTTTNNTADGGNLLDLEPTPNDADKPDPGLSPTNKESSMLDRRLALTDRKRMQKEELGERTSKNTTEDVDLDQDLAEIGRYFAKRNPAGTGKYDVEVEMNGEWSGSRVRDIRQLDTDLVSAKTVISGQESHRAQQNGLAEESFVPRARDETAEVVRNSSRPVRAIIDQQTDVVQLLKSTSRGVDDLESEIRGLRATFLDRQARIETLRNAVDTEIRAYQADQQAANERIQQQQIPGGHFVRDEFMRVNNIGPLPRTSAIEDLLGGASPRRRSGSVSSTSGLAGAAVPSGMTSSDLEYKSSSLNSWVLGTRVSAPDQSRRIDVDDDASSTASGFSVTRSRRGGSVVRERSYMTEDPTTSRMEMSRSYLMPSYDASSPYAYGETSARSTISTSYSPQQTSFDLRSYVPSSVAAVSYYGGSDTGGYQGNDSRSYGYSSYSSSSSTPTNDPSRFRRAQSVSDFSSERSLSSDRYNPAFSSSGGQFQSRFLDKVRSRKSYGDDQYRSRFLASDSGSSRYHSGRRGYSSND